MKTEYGAFGNDIEKMRAIKAEKARLARQEYCSHDHIETAGTEKLVCRKCGHETTA